jgi:hypothetical protein
MCDIEHIVYNTVGNTFEQYLTVSDLRVLAHVSKLSRLKAKRYIYARMVKYLTSLGSQVLEAYPLRSLIRGRIGRPDDKYLYVMDIIAQTPFSMLELYDVAMDLFARNLLAEDAFVAMSIEINLDITNESLIKLLSLEQDVSYLNQLISVSLYRFNATILNYLLERVKGIEVNYCPYMLHRECRELLAKSMIDKSINDLTSLDSLSVNTFVAVVYQDLELYIEYLKVLYPTAIIPIDYIKQIFETNPKNIDLETVSRLHFKLQPCFVEKL